MGFNKVYWSTTLSGPHLIMIFTIAGALVHMPQMQSEHGLKCKSIPDIDMIV